MSWIENNGTRMVDRRQITFLSISHKDKKEVDTRSFNKLLDHYQQAVWGRETSSDTVNLRS